jgi:hypothetical protein
MEPATETHELELTEAEYQHLLDDTSYYGPGRPNRLFEPVSIKFVKGSGIETLHYIWEILNVNFIVNGVVYSHKIYRYAYHQIADGSRAMCGHTPSNFEPEKLDEKFGKNPFYERFIRNHLHKATKKT